MCMLGGWEVCSAWGGVGGDGDSSCMSVALAGQDTASDPWYHPLKDLKAHLSLYTLVL